MPIARRDPQHAIALELLLQYQQARHIMQAVQAGIDAWEAAKAGGAPAKIACMMANQAILSANPPTLMKDDELKVTARVLESFTGALDGANGPPGAIEPAAYMLIFTLATYTRLMRGFDEARRAFSRALDNKQGLPGAYSDAVAVLDKWIATARGMIAPEPSRKIVEAVFEAAKATIAEAFNS